MLVAAHHFDFTLLHRVGAKPANPMQQEYRFLLDFAFSGTELRFHLKGQSDNRTKP